MGCQVCCDVAGMYAVMCGNLLADMCVVMCAEVWAGMCVVMCVDMLTVGIRNLAQTRKSKQMLFPAIGPEFYTDEEF